MPSEAVKVATVYFAPPPVISGEPEVEGEPEKAPVTTLAKPLPSQPTWPIMFGYPPNIVGSLVSTGGECLLAEANFAIEQSGALYCETYNGSKGAKGDTYDADGTYDIKFDASKSAAIYSGNSLQPSALQALVCIKA